jgi:hypothetical protein
MAEGRARRVSTLAEGLRTLDASELDALDGAIETLERIVRRLGRVS